MTRFASPAFLVAFVWAAGGCCTEIDDTECVDWSQPTSCPTRADASAALGLDRNDVVRSDATFWPARTYLIDGKPIVEPAQCCYDVTITQCTTELH